MLFRSKKRNENHKFSTNTIVLATQSGSMPKFLQSSHRVSLVSCQQHKWNLLHFSTVPRGYWKVEDNQRNYLNKIGRELGVKEMDDWYNVCIDEVKRRAIFIHHYYNNSLFTTLQKLYPQHNWDPL